ncbi:hypothetical protein ACFZAV_38850 [Streptomyces sp. NPDC008343]|uniref:hypothetical protein n=1 Tax=Streptomyces sp. NPDC008343 TaxID=3364828 RepID=UPI0036DFD00D
MQLNRRTFTLMAAATLLPVPGTASAKERATTASTVTLGAPQIVPIPDSPATWYANDSTFPYLRNSANTAYITFWINGGTYRSTGQGLSRMGPVSPTTSVLSGGASGTFDGNGVWLFAAQRDPNNPTGPIYGFYHAENHVFAKPGEHAEWNSTGLAVSTDDGVTWTKKGKIIGTPQPSAPSWGGPEANSVIYDKANKRWLAIGHGTGYVSTAANAAPGTWKGWYQGAFRTPMPSTTASPLLDPLPGLSENMANSNVTWNTYLNRYVMVWMEFGQTRQVKITTSADGVHWDPSELLFQVDSSKSVNYPQIIGATSSQAGKDATLVYEQWPPSTAERSRDMIKRPIQFT